MKWFIAGHGRLAHTYRDPLRYRCGLLRLPSDPAATDGAERCAWCQQEHANNQGERE